MSVVATRDEWASLAIALSGHFIGLTTEDVMGTKHCRRALALLQRVADASG